MLKAKKKNIQWLRFIQKDTTPKKNFEVTTSVIETNSTYDTKDM